MTFKEFMGEYQWSNMQIAIANMAWDAAQAEMKERCAGVCDGLEGYLYHEDANACAAAIRALDKEK